MIKLFIFVFLLSGCRGNQSESDSQINPNPEPTDDSKLLNLDSVLTKSASKDVRCGGVVWHFPTSEAGQTLGVYLAEFWLKNTSFINSDPQSIRQYLAGELNDCTKSEFTQRIKKEV